MRTLLSGVAASLLVAALTLAAAGAAAVIPRFVARLAADQLSYEIDQLAPTQRDVTGTQTFPPPHTAATPSGAAAAFRALDSALRSARTGFPAVLRAATEPASYNATTLPQVATAADFNPKAALRLGLSADPHAGAHLRITAGRAPAVWVPASGAPVEIIVSAATARVIHARVGDSVTTLLDGARRPVRISGIFTPLHPHDDYWQNTTNLLAPGVEPSAELSTDTVSGFVAADSMGPLSSDFVSGTLTFWVPVVASRVTPDTSSAVSAGLRHLEASGIALPGSIASGGQTTAVQTDVVGTISTAFRGIGAFVALGSMEIAGPAGVVLAVFALGVRAVIERRRPTLALMAARGAGSAQLRGAMALEGLLIGMPAAIIATVAGSLVGPASGATAVIVPLFIGLVPAALFAATTSPRGLRVTRTDVGAHDGGRARRLVEIVVVALAVVGLVVLARRGLVSVSLRVGVDPLLVATPLLLSLAVCLGVVRLYPLPLRAVLAALRRRRGAVAFVGASRAIRDPAVGIAAVLALVVGISVATFSAVMLSTLDAGLHTAAVETVGADVAVAGDGVTPSHIRRFGAIPGVAAVAASDQRGPVTFESRSTGTDVELILSNTRDLGRVHPGVPTGMSHLIDGRVPVLIAKDFASQVPSSGDAMVDGTPVRVVGELPLLSQFGSEREWVLADAALASRIDDATAQPDHVLIAANPGASVPRIAAAVRRILGSDASTTTVLDTASALSSTESAPSLAGVRLTLLAAAVVSSVLAALAAVLGSVIGTGERNRSIGVLRTLGMSARQSGGLVAWELGPVAIAAVVAGGLLGIGLPWVVTTAVDLRAFTGAAARSVPAYDPWSIVAVIGGFVGVTIAATLLAVVFGNRLNPASTLKMGAE